MSIVTNSFDSTGKYVQSMLLHVSYDEKLKKILDDPSVYNPTPAERDMTSLILKHFNLGNTTMFKPRVEFNDLSVIMRDQVDQMSWNTYQPNNGLPMDGDAATAWRSNAIRPVVRNKIISIAAHATARLIFPRIFAFNQESDQDSDAAQVMSDLIEFASEQSNYEYYSLQRVLAALYSPASIGFTEYAEVYRNVKKERGADGKWILEPMLDEDMSGFRDEVVPVDQLFIENFYESDIQKQGWLILRKVFAFSTFQTKYASAKNYEYVRPGVQTLYNDANQSWYCVYDTNMRQDEVEEITYWNKNLDVKIVLVNGVMMTEPDEPNPRIDKRYPFDKFGFELINTRCFYYMSAAFKFQPDATIINTLYPMMVDGTYLNIMKPMVAVGGEMIQSDVIVPGAVTTLKDPNADLRPINTNIDLVSGANMLQTVEASITESAADQQRMRTPNGASPGAYEISRIESKAEMALGPFVKMISAHVKDFGRLRISDILQHYTIPEVSKIEADAPLVYKTFLLPDKHSVHRSKTRKIKFDGDIKTDNISEADYLDLSFQTLEEQGGIDASQEIWKVNPVLFRDMKYMCGVSPDLMNPMSEELERAYDLEQYDRLINNPKADQEEVLRLFLSAYPKTRKNPSKYIQNGDSNPMQQIDPSLPNLNTQGPGQPASKQLSRPSARAQAGSPAGPQISPVAPSMSGMV